MKVFEKHLRAWGCILFLLGILLMACLDLVTENLQLFQGCSVESVKMLLSLTFISCDKMDLPQEEHWFDDTNGIRPHDHQCLWEVAKINNGRLERCPWKSSLSGWFIWREITASPCLSLSDLLWSLCVTVTWYWLPLQLFSEPHVFHRYQSVTIRLNAPD